MELIKVKIIDAHRAIDDDGSLMESLNEAYGFNDGDIVEAECVNGAYFIGESKDAYLRDGEFEVME